MLLFEHKQHYQSSKQRKIFAFKEKDYNKRLVGTTQHSSRLVTSPTLKCA